MKARLEEKLADVDSKTESFQNEITNMQKFQESEGARQQTMWDAAGMWARSIFVRREHSSNGYHVSTVLLNHNW